MYGRQQDGPLAGQEFQVLEPPPKVLHREELDPDSGLSASIVTMPNWARMVTYGPGVVLSRSHDAPHDLSVRLGAPAYMR